MASHDQTGNLKLVAKDSRNIDVSVTGNAANLGFGGGVVQGESMRLISKEAYTVDFATSTVNTSALGNIGTTTPAGAPNPLGGISTGPTLGFIDDYGDFDSSGMAGTEVGIDGVSGVFVETGAQDYSGHSLFLMFMNNNVRLYADNNPNKISCGGWNPVTGGLIGTDFNALSAGTASFTLNGSVINFNFSTGAGFDNIS